MSGYIYKKKSVREKLNLSKNQITWLYVSIHTLVWTMIFLLPFAFFEDSISDILKGFNILIFAIVLIIFYLNYCILVPKLLLRKKIGYYFLAILAIIIFNILININKKPFFNPPPHKANEESFMRPNKRVDNQEYQEFLQNEMDKRRSMREGNIHARKPPFKFFRIIGPLSFILMLIGVGTSLKLAEQWFKSEKHKKEVKNEQLSTELAFLKSQINPHFLFNSLNSIYSLAHQKSDLAPEAIIRLSKIMRYIIDDAASSKVLLEKELEHLSDYIELQKLRLTHKTILTYNVDQQAGNETIEPMLLVPFIENAFKHGVDSVNISRITIKITVANNLLTFKSTNTIARQKTETMEAESGIGLKNVKRRLELLYPNEYSLNTLEEEKLYSVSLKLKLKNYELLNS